MIKHLGVFAILLSCSLISQAQIDVKDIYFTSKNVDFGTIYLEQGIVTAKYEFVNLSSDTFKISNISAACGCTNPRSDKMEYAPNEKGTIMAEFNPKGMSGEVDKWIYIRGNLSNSFQIKLRLKANIRTLDNIAFTQRFPGQFGYLVLSKSAIGFGTVYSETRLDSLLLLNDGDVTYSVLEVNNLPDYIRAVNLPLAVEPQGKQFLKFEVDPAVADTVGPVIGMMKLLTNDKYFPNKSIDYRVTFADDFKHLSRRKRKRAPKIVLSTNTLDFGPMKPGQKKSMKFEITNTGRSPLEIRRVYSDCACAILSDLTRSIQPGETIAVTAQFDALFKSGNQRKPIVLYTNDPTRPKLSVFLLAQL